MTAYKFKSIADVQKAVELLKKERKGKNTHYPVLFKKVIIEFMKKNEYRLEPFAEEVEIAKSTLYNWQKQAEDGLFTLEGAYNVSTKSKALNESILTELNQQLEDLTEKIRIVEAAEKAGLKIVA